MKQGLVRIALVLLAVATLSVASEAQQQRTVRGTVTDSATAAPVVNATVQVRGTNVGTITDEDGAFVLRGVPGGEATLIVRRIGYRQRTVSVPPGRTQVAISLRTDYVRLDELVVTGRATETARRNLATTVATVSGEELNAGAPGSGIEDKLQGKVSGAVISSNSGAPGGGMQIRVRGSSSINASSSPLYVIDGVIMSNDAPSSGLAGLTGSDDNTNASLQDDPVNRSVDINPEDIESVEVLKGATAAAIYGSKAANGVVIITTKKGEEGGPRLRISPSFGVFDLRNKIGSRTFETVEEALDAGITFASQEPYRSNIENGRVFDNEQALADRNALSYDVSASVAGGTEGVDYYGSLLWKDEESIVENTGFDKQSARLNLSPQLGEDWSVNLNLSYIHSQPKRGIFNNGNDFGQTAFMVFASTPSFVDLRAGEDGVFPENPGDAFGSNPLQQAALVENTQDVNRGLGSANIEWGVWQNDSHEVRLSSTVGADIFHQQDEIISPPQVYNEEDDGLPGTSILTRTDNEQLNASVNGLWEFHTDLGITSTFSTGAQFERQEQDLTRLVGKNQNAGFPNLDVSGQLSTFERRTVVEDFGVYVQEEILALDERLFLSGSVRFDQSSSNGSPDDVFVYPNASASFRFPDLGSVVQEVKIRGAFGQSGNKPLFGQKFTNLSAQNNVEGIPGVIVGLNAGSSDMEPETTTEYEAGVDVTLFGGRAGVEATVYRQEIDNLVLQRELADSRGFQTQFFNGGELENEGIEATLRATPLAGELTWNSITTFSTNSSEVLSLPVPAFRPAAGFGIGGRPLIEEGSSLTQIVGLVDGEEEKIGDAEPAFTFGFSNSFQFAGFSFRSVLDWRYDRDVNNLTELLYDIGQVSPDFEDDGEVRPASECDDECSGLERLLGFASQNTESQYVQDATFLKVRELSLAYDLPESVVAALPWGVESLRVHVTGRDLWAITDYRGLDPEVSNFGHRSVGRNFDVSPFPPSRSVWLGFDATF